VTVKRMDNVGIVVEDIDAAIEFAEAVKRAGKPVTFLVGQGYNHFEMFETLGNPYGLAGRAMLELMKLNAA